MAVVFKDTTLRYHAPVSYSLYSMLAHAPFPGRLYKGIVEGKIPQVQRAGPEAYVTMETGWVLWTHLRRIFL